MNQPIDWQEITAPLDVMNLPVPDSHIRRWEEWTRSDAGVRFRCRLANDQPVNVWLEVIAADIIRFRMNVAQIRSGPQELLVSQRRSTTSFELAEQAESLILTTDALRIEFQRFPWQMRVYDRQNRRAIFSQRFDDRAYGYTYEVPPTGFDKQPDGRLTARETVAVSPGERFYGFGEQYTSLNKWGQEITAWAVDSGNVTSHRSYKNIPFFMSSAGYGIFIHSSFPLVYRMGSESSISYSFHLADSQLDYFLIYGPDFKQILKRYTDLTGRAPLPPKWSFGFWISRCGYKTQTEVETVIREMRARDFPCDVISLDPWWMGDGPWSTYEWDRQAFPEPEKMVQRLRDQGVRTCLWIHPYVPAGTEIYDEGLERGYFVTDGQGRPSPALEAFTGTELAAIDFTNPAAAAWFQAKLEALLEMGVAVFKSDFGEQAPVEAVYHDGRSGLEMHNLYPLLYNRAVFELTERYFGRGLTWGRSGYAGSQRYPIQWGGDSYSSLDQIAGQLRGLLSYGLSGVPFCSHDVGGFDYSPQAFDHPSQEDYPKDEITYIRWLQFGVFSSHLRAHGKQPREPWTYGPQIEEIARRYLKLRYRLLPYIYSQAVQATQTGLPVVKPLVLEYPSDPNTHHLDWQYLFGDSFLVAPVLSREGRVQVYLPEGDWIDYWTKEHRPGGRWLELTASLEMIPVWVRAGAIMPLGPELAFVEEKPLDPLTLELYYPADTGETVIYDEDRPGIPVSYTCRKDELEVKLGAVPGQVELILYGLRPVESAQHTGRPVPVSDHQGGQRIRFDGTTAGSVTFLLKDKT